MDWTVVWTEPAVADLEQIVRKAASQSPAAAEALRAELLESVEVLSRFPLIGPTYERDRSGRTREILCRRYRIFYRVIDAQRRVEFHHFRVVCLDQQFLDCCNMAEILLTLRRAT